MCPNLKEKNKCEDHEEDKKNQRKCLEEHREWDLKDEKCSFQHNPMCPNLREKGYCP